MVVQLKQKEFYGEITMEILSDLFIWLWNLYEKIALVGFIPVLASFIIFAMKKDK